MLTQLQLSFGYSRAHTLSIVPHQQSQRFYVALYCCGKAVWYSDQLMLWGEIMDLVEDLKGLTASDIRPPREEL